ncbi:MAG: zinc ABC transporter substrate-binding protein [Elusimicrobia bacterium]|nr:zinc ABC transporter substrate-binding protein [Elusimicrobiota bacterium]
MKKLAIGLVALIFSADVYASSKLQVVTTTEDLAALTREVGGDWVEATSIAKGSMDPHFVDAKPSYLLRLKRADLFIQVGLELEVAWAPPLLTNARNSKILPGNQGFLEASENCEILQKPTGQVDRSMGDVHPLGNPHFWLDPANGRIIALNISNKLSELDPSHAEDYKKNLALFQTRLTQKEKEWDRLVPELKGLKVVTYHNSWPNFAKRFGIQVVNFVEPKPGIPPSPAHVQSLIHQIKTEKILLILMEPYFDTKLPQKIAQETGAKLAIFPPSVGADKNIKTYLDLFDFGLKLLKNALSRSGEKS